MASQVGERYRNGAEIYNGDALCKKKSIELLVELILPNGLFPLEDIEEFGFNRNEGFIWLLQKKKKDHNFKKIKRAVSYAQQVTAFVEKDKMKKMTGVKTKSLCYGSPSLRCILRTLLLGRSPSRPAPGSLTASHPLLFNLSSSRIAENVLKH